MNIALDTNVLIYLHDNINLHKRTVAQDLLADNPNISSQVVSEYLNVTRRVLNLSKEELLTKTSGLLSGCAINPVLPATLLMAAELVKKYKFQMFDAVIVASAIESGCEILYSEDMHSGLLIEKSLTIVNPFF